ncbi:hypothetical protein KHC23_10925 [Ancylobacter dichloromethanicus]|uniref:Uncharacterized protein n=1 Tax=Ancylobacter dichloromethanicus TaxID=518825 RepID=A0A9W6J5R0_9HYPH|nr:hypothetical protein [Ancylobacter dichloromethanicus]MBS7554161.1 hypothetical protein [Ancylobacter dichloromethanicus]GLK71281.1 hypothetical protein GCM10017643_13960 [Ancylobacter dichloromethanicus]
MIALTLTEPLDVEGGPISTVTIREPSGLALLELALHVPLLRAWAGADAEARKAGRRVFPTSAVFRAMVVVAGALTGIGTERAGKLLFADIDKIVAKGARLIAKAMAAEPPLARAPRHPTPPAGAG